MALSHSPRIVTDGLVLALDAANSRSYSGTGTTWSDLSGNGNNGTLTNGPTYDSADNGSIVFDGVNDYVSSSYAPPAGTDPRTISIWFKPDISQNKNLLGYGTNATLQLWDVLLHSGNVGVHLYSSGNEAGTPYVVGQWQNIVFTFTAPTITSYMNGTIKNSYTNTGINTGTVNTLNISKGNYSYFYFDGSIAQVSVYNRALTAAEVAQNFNATRGRYGI